MQRIDRPLQTAIGSIGTVEPVETWCIGLKEGLHHYPDDGADARQNGRSLLPRPLYNVAK
jgi:hypothetical protein